MDTREQIELYALGKLAGNELADFRSRLDTDPNFAAEVAKEAEMIRAIRLAPDLEAFRAQLAGIEQDIGAESGTGSGPKRLYYLLAVAAILVVAVAIWFLSRPVSAPDPQKLFAAHFKPPAALDKIKRGDEIIKNETESTFQVLWAAAEKDYSRGQYDAAVKKLSQLQTMPESVAFADDLAYSKGLACMRSGQTAEAIAAFEKITSSYLTEKPWYLALSHLKSGQTSEAKIALEKIAGSASPFSGEAKEILLALK